MDVNFTDHALERLSERSKLTPDELRSILDENLTIQLGKEEGTNRSAKLIFSIVDKKFFVVIQDDNSGYVVTLLPIDYWHNLTEKYYFKKLNVTKKNLISLIEMVDPDNPILKHEPLGNKKKVRLALCYKDDLGYQKLLNAGTVDIGSFLSERNQDLAILIKEKISFSLLKKNLTIDSIEGVRWAIGKELMVKGVEFSEDEEFFLNFTNKIKKDVTERKRLIKIYDDFSEIFSRKKSLVNVKE